MTHRGPPWTRLRPVAGYGFALWIAACSHRPQVGDCADMTPEECTWTHSTQAAIVTPTAQSTVLRLDDDPRETKAGWEKIDAILTRGIHTLAEGIVNGAVDAVAREWCATPNAPVSTAAGGVCELADPPQVGGRDLSLEFDGSGLFALVGLDFTGTQSDQIVRTARERWRHWCVEKDFTALESDGTHEFHNCALPDGLVFVVGRFAHNLEADLWQVSLAVMGAG